MEKCNYIENIEIGQCILHDSVVLFRERKTVILLELCLCIYVYGDDPMKQMIKQRCLLQAPRANTRLN